MDTVEYGDMVKIAYTGKLSDGEVFDSNEGGDPIEFPAGYGTLIKGIDVAVIGMNLGDEKEINIEPELGYGFRDDNLFQTIPRDMFQEGDLPEIGMIVMVATKDGYKVPATVSEIRDTEFLLDFNHPLAGKTLNFKIKVIGLTKGPVDLGGCDCGCGHGHDQGVTLTDGGCCGHDDEDCGCS